MASPRLARYRTENGDLDKDYTSIRTSRTGLSEYTTKRLEELRAKREAREKDKDGSITSASSYSSTSDYLAEYRAKKAMSSTTTPAGSDLSPTSTSSPSTISPVSATNPSLSSTPSWSAQPSVLGIRETKSELLNISANDSGIGISRNDSLRSEDDECVGFASLPEQVHRKAVKRGFDFTLMVVGESGLGKSTLINSLFRKDLYQDRIMAAVEERLEKTVEITKHHMEIEEKGVKLRLTVVDTPGFNDSVNASHCCKPVEDYVDLQFEQYYKDETGLNRKNIKDNRVHCCLYFISPFGHGLRQMDVEFMKRLHEKVNIVPVIAKADTLTPKEIRNLKTKVLDQVQEQKIKIYELPDCDSDEDEDFKQQNSELKAAVPFAVIGSNTLVEVSGKKVRGRLYSWGIVDVDNPQHCDFGKLRKMLISTHMQDLKELTRDVHYENFRARILKDQLTSNSKERNDEQIQNNNEYAPSKLKRDSSPNFEAIMNADHVLQQKEEEIRRMKEMITKMQQELNAKKNNNITQPAVNGLGNL